MLDNVIYEYQLVKDTKLKQYIENTPAIQPYFSAGFNGVRAKQYCGIINFEGKDFYILPKIAKSKEMQTNLNIFIYMLSFSNNINVKNEDLSTSFNHASNNILEVFIQMFAKNLFKELQKGIYKEYITYQDNLKVLRGRYLINENLKHNHTKNKIYCEFDEFSMDNELNAFFLYAIKTLMNYTKNTNLLKMCELVFDEVGFKQFDINNIDINFNRLNQRFKSSFEFALLLLQKSIPMFDKGKKSFAFLFDMNELFEDFIGNIYKSIDKNTKLQTKNIFGNLVLKPDILCDNLIIDTKYKLVKNRDDLKTNDKYQMFVYGINFNIENTMLLYPKHCVTLSEDLILGKDDKIINLKLRSIDLEFSGGYSEFIEEIRQRIKLL